MPSTGHDNNTMPQKYTTEIGEKHGTVAHKTTAKTTIINMRHSWQILDRILSFISSSVR